MSIKFCKLPKCLECKHLSPLSDSNVTLNECVNKVVKEMQLSLHVSQLQSSSSVVKTLDYLMEGHEVKSQPCSPATTWHMNKTLNYSVVLNVNCFFVLGKSIYQMS